MVANLSFALGEWKRTGWGMYGYGCPYRLSRDPDTVLCYDASIAPGWVVDMTAHHAAYLDGRPDLAVEVIDRSDPPDAIGELVDRSVSAGIGLFWLVNPFDRTVTVHRPGETARVVASGDELDATSVLPGLRCPVARLFE